MKHTRNDSVSILTKAKMPKPYGTSISLAARHFHGVGAQDKATIVADAMLAEPGVEVVGVLDASGRALGLLRKEHILSLLGKPFGREILARIPVAEIAERATSYSADSGLFAVAEGMLEGGSDTRAPYAIIEDDFGRFLGLVATRDLTDYLSRMTREDIALAGALQDRLMAGNRSVTCPGLAHQAWSRPAKGIGGDFWFVKDLGCQRSFLCLCDVSGKGVAASLVMSMVWGMLSAFDYRRGLEELILALNETVITTFHLEKYLTGFFAIHDAASGSLEIADMGHSHVLLHRGNRVYRPKGKRPNLPIGIERDFKPALDRWKLLPGDTLMVFSDGLIEQENGRGEEFGIVRLARAFSNLMRTGEPLAASLPAVLDDFKGRTAQQDDISFVAFGPNVYAAALRKNDT